ncbi:MAG: DNA repair protein RecN [Ruminococcaceae bacterium]|nr:DNA repair protein RecN [Oscillospiraceae bacterium]
MLLSLHIENLAVIKCIDIDFPNGFIVLTGETGAGKSIIIDSINLLLGAKADRDLIRTGENSALVSGVFCDLSDEVKRLLSESGIQCAEDGNILIQRSFSLDGKSSIKINGRSVTLVVLRAVAEKLVSIHGQNDTFAIADSKNQLELIDLYASNEELLCEYRLKYSKLEEIRLNLRELLKKEQERERLCEILQYQINDIDSYGLYDGEEEELVERKLKIKNSEKLLKNLNFVFKALKGSEKGSVSFLLDKSATALEQLSDVIPKFSEYSESLRDFLYQVEDIAEEAYAQSADIDNDPEASLNEIESRLDKISKLKRKYGLTIKDILEFRDKTKNELDTLQNSEALIKELQKQENEAYNEAILIANALHERRVFASKEIESEVKETLEFLDMPKVVFYASIKEAFEEKKKILNEYGSDNAEFYLSANRGADAQPLSKVASGGELSRVMLALKGAINDKDGISTVIFDEIDTGVSGKTARKIGIKMLSLSKSSQLFSVTHSAQIASLADSHYLISKSDVDGATQTSVRLLDREGRVAELSRILGGIAVTNSQRRAAVDMLEEKNSYV